MELVDSADGLVPKEYINLKHQVGDRVRLTRTCYTPRCYPLPKGTKGIIYQVQTQGGLTWIIFQSCSGFRCWVQPGWYEPLRTKKFGKLSRIAAQHLLRAKY